MVAATGLTPHVEARWQRLHSPRRAAGIDLARGLAVIGMFAAHLLVIPAFDWQTPSTWVDVVNGRSSVLFATLAGVSIGLVSGRTEPFEGARLSVTRRRLAVRAFLVWVLGIALISLSVPVYVILPAYAVLFLIVLPLLRLPATWLFALAAALAVTMPFVQFAVQRLPFWQTSTGWAVDAAIGGHYPFIVWSAFVVTGLGIARTHFTTAGAGGILMAVGASLAALGYGFAETMAPYTAIGGNDLLAFVTNGDPHSSGIGEVVGTGGFAVAIIGLCVLVARTPLTWVLLPIRAMGSMALTAYAAQLVVWAALQPQPGAGQTTLSAFRDLEPFWPMTLWTIVLCTAWALLVGRGALEWAIDRVTRFAVRG